MKKILVIGGAGFIGRSLLKCIRENYPDFKLTSFDLNPVSIEGVDDHIGSVLDKKSLSKIFKNYDCVIHLAAVLGVRRTEIERLLCLDVNIQGTKNVLDECKNNNISKIIFISSSEVYGDQKIIPITENNPLNPKSVYAISKLAGEEYVQAYSSQFGMNYNIIRFFNVYGPGQVAEFVIPKFVSNISKNIAPNIYGDGNQIRSFCHVDDASKGVISLIMDSKSPGEIFHIGNDTEPISLKELAEKAIQINNSDLTPNFIPLNRSDRNEGREIYKRIPDISKARKLLNYNPKISLEDGLSDMFNSGLKFADSWDVPTEKK